MTTRPQARWVLPRGVPPPNLRRRFMSALDAAVRNDRGGASVRAATGVRAALREG